MNAPRTWPAWTILACLLTVIAGCGQPSEQEQPVDAGPAAPAETAPEPAGTIAERDVFFGAVHVHTRYSFDAYTNGSLANPADAYRWARGETIVGGGGGDDLKIRTPLDFYAVSDHAEWMGVFKEMENPESPLSEHPLAGRITDEDANVRMQAFAQVLRDFSGGESDHRLMDP